MLVARRLTSGDKLPPERELATSFGVSRVSLRQALKALEVMGVIRQKIGDGTYLTEDSDLILGESIEFLCLIDEISFRDLYETRLILEPELAALAAERAGHHDLKAIRSALNRMRDCGNNGQSHFGPEGDFHSAIARAAGNRVWELVFRSFYDSLTRPLQWKPSLQVHQEAVDEHRRILEAIEDRDPDTARQLMRERILQSRKRDSDIQRASLATATSALIQ